MLESANPVLYSRTRNDSSAFATMQVSDRRRASRSASVSKDSAATFVSFHRTELRSRYSQGFSNGHIASPLANDAAVARRGCENEPSAYAGITGALPNLDRNIR